MELVVDGRHHPPRSAENCPACGKQSLICRSPDLCMNCCIPSGLALWVQDGQTMLTPPMSFTDLPRNITQLSELAQMHWEAE